VAWLDLASNYFLLRKVVLALEKNAYAVILSEAKDLLPKASQQVEEILRFARNDRLVLVPR
jgi:hypothetical protein